MLKQFKLNPYFKAVYNGIYIKPLPDNLYKIYDNIFFRIFRVLGGLSALIVLSRINLSLPNFIQYILLSLGLFQLIQMTLFSFLKFIYIYRKWKYQPEEFKVRDYPLNRYLTLLTKGITCLNMACILGFSACCILGIGLFIDRILDNLGQLKVFQPLLIQVIQLLFL